MWNQFQTDEYQGMLAETITMPGHNGDLIHTYISRPLGEGPFPGIVLIPHMPGWDEFYRETTRRFSQHGNIAICPDIYCRFGHGTPEEISIKVRNEGGVPDESVIGDCGSTIKYLKSQPNSNNKVGVIGTCSGGRHSFMVACQASGVDAAVNCWGGRIVVSHEELTIAQPVAPIDYTEKLTAEIIANKLNEIEKNTNNLVFKIDNIQKWHGYGPKIEDSTYFKWIRENWSG